MTTARHAASSAGPRHSRRLYGRRLRREELLAVVFLLAVLLATVVLLALQWLKGGPSPTTAGLPVLPYLLGGTT